MSIGVLEFPDNDFARSIAGRLADLEPVFIRAAALRIPSPPPHPLIIDRVSFCDPFLRELMRIWSLAGAYVLNDPFYTLTSDKLSDLLWCDALGIPRPRTILLPRFNAAEGTQEIVDEPDWQAVLAEVGLPCVLKPVDGYAWQDVHVIATPLELVSRYEALKGTRTLLVQELVRHTQYYRAFCVGGKDVLITSWLPRPLDRGVYAEADPASLADVGHFIEEKTAVLNAALGLDFNSVEWCVTEDRRPVIIDSHNDVPDVRPEKLPERCYDWIVERVCACVRERLASGARNRWPALSGLPEPGPSPR
jgi:hypothetical protein